MRKTLRATALTLALCGPAFAGDIPNPLGPEPAGRTAVTGETMAATEPTAVGEMQNGLTATLLSVIESVLTLF